jgi:hypothetical protein
VRIALADRVLSESSFSHIVSAPIERVDIAGWLFSLRNSEFRRCCSPDHIACGASTAVDGRPMSINGKARLDVLSSGDAAGDDVAAAPRRRHARREASTSAAAVGTSAGNSRDSSGPATRWSESTSTRRCWLSLATRVENEGPMNVRFHIGQFVNVVGWLARRVRRCETTSTRPRASMERIAPEAPMPASPRSNPPRAVTRMIVGGVFGVP